MEYLIAFFDLWVTVASQVEICVSKVSFGLAVEYTRLYLGLWLYENGINDISIGRMKAMRCSKLVMRDVVR